MAEEEKKNGKHGRLDSLASVESEIGGHEQLKSVLMGVEEHDIQGEEVMVCDSLSIIRQSGGDGNYQKLMLTGIILPGIAIFFIIVMMPYMQLVPNPILCKSADGKTTSVCSVEQACSNKYGYDLTRSTSNWITDFGLLCQSTSFLKLIYYFFFGGFFLGATLLAPLADYFGRKSLLVLSVVLLCVVHLKAVFTTDVVTCAVVLACSGVFVGVYYCVGITYLTEIATQDGAVIYSVMFHMAFPISGVVVMVSLRYLRDWKVTTSIMALIPLILLVYSAYVTESPRFLAAKGMYADARYSSNVICLFNTNQKKRWQFNYEKASYMNEYEKFAEDRDNRTYQHGYFLQFLSGRYYIFAFSILLYCSGFAFSGLALAQRQIFKSQFANELILYFIEGFILFVTGFLIQAFGHVKTIGFSLVCTGVLGIVSVVVLWINDYAFGLCGYVTKLFAFVAFVGSVSFAAENCPARVRATGFSASVGVGVLGLMSGAFLLEFYDNLHILFGIVAICGLFAFTMVKEPSMYLNNDDIHEINEMRKSNYKEDSQKRPTISEPGLKIIEPSPKSPGLILNPIPVEAKLSPDDPVLYQVEGHRVVNELQEQLGIELMNISLEGEISYEGKDEIGEYALKGKIKDGNKIDITKTYKKDKKALRYEGARVGANVSGTWSDENGKGAFNFAFKLKPWKGCIVVKGQEVQIEWHIGQTGRKIYGMGDTNGTAHYVSGVVQETEVTMIVTDENGINMGMEGKLVNNALDVTFPDGTLSLKTVKDPSSS